MSYALYDFTESIERAPFGPTEVKRVIAAWGHGDGMGQDEGHLRFGDSASDWSGGFLLEMHDGRFCYLTGWCDYTGWGCQDGIDTSFFDAQPALSDLADHAPEEWDHEPVDLNRWLQLPEEQRDEA